MPKPVITPTFLRATAAAGVVVRLDHRNSVRPSFCLSYGWISQKQCKLGSPNSAK